MGHFSLKIKQLLKLSAILAIAFSVSGCALFAPVCNKPGAFQQGVTDGQYRVPENLNYAATCPAHIGRINRAYQHGYRRGMRMPAIHFMPIVIPVGPGPGWHPHPGHRPRPYHPGHHPRPGPRPHPQPGPRPHPHHHHATHTHVIPMIPAQPHATPTHVIPKIPAQPHLLMGTVKH